MKLFRPLFFIFLIGLTLWQGISLGRLLYKYTHRNTPIVASIWESSAFETKKRYGVDIACSYQVQGRDYHLKEKILPKNCYSMAAAQSVQRAFDQSPHLVWYDARNPEKAALVHYFPYKEMVYTSIVFLVSLYFTFLMMTNWSGV